MLAILSLLGVGGGLGALLFFVPGARAIVGAVLKGIAEMIGRYPWQCAFLAAMAWGTWERFDAIHARATTRAWKAKYDTHLESDRKVAAKAEQEGKGDAAVTHTQHTVIRTVYRDVAGRYADTHRVVVPEGSGLDPGGAAPAGLPENPAAPAGLPDADQLVAITRKDLIACTDDYAYALSLYLDGKRKVEAGKAVYDDPPPREATVFPEVEFGKGD